MQEVEKLTKILLKSQTQKETVAGERAAIFDGKEIPNILEPGVTMDSGRSQYWTYDFDQADRTVITDMYVLLN